VQISITLLIIAFTVIVSMQAFGNYGILDKLRHHPVRESGMREYYRLLSSGFVHADWMHLIINMFVLYNFGEMIEAYVIHLFGAAKGRVIFLLLYLLNIVLANLPTAFRHRHDPGFSSIGASGAVSGMVFIFILLQPWAMLYFFFIIPVPAIIAGIGYLAYSSWAANHGHGRIDHSAHFAGAVAGMAMIILLDHRIVPEFLHRLVSGFPL
jgi:membrane associated rhomboid family serine protease